MSLSSSRSCGLQHPTIVVFMWMTAIYCTSKFHCPQMVEIGSSVNLTCNVVDATSQGHSYVTPSTITAATCHLSDGYCIPREKFTASVINITSSVLTIPKTLKTHGGVWKCTGDADNLHPETCHISVFKLPKCEITSGQNISSLIEGAMLTLSVNLTRRFCSELARIRLMTGKVSTALINDTGTDITPKVLTRKFNVTSSDFGDVHVMYTCGGDSWNVSCTGVKELIEGILPGVTTSSTQSTAPPSSDGSDAEKVHSDCPWKLIFGIPIPVIIIIIAIVIVIVNPTARARATATARNIIRMVRRRNNNPSPENNEAHVPEEAVPLQDLNFGRST